MRNLFYLVILWYSLIWPTYSITPGWTVRGNYIFHEASAGPSIIDSIGGMDQLELEVEEALRALKCVF
jgi:hypothetical protein